MFENTDFFADAIRSESCLRLSSDRQLRERLGPDGYVLLAQCPRRRFAKLRSIAHHRLTPVTAPTTLGEVDSTSLIVGH
jgi:hypothetical protein